LGVDGVVFGILNPDGTLDKARCKELIDKARPLRCTCHRAFDMTRDPFQALEDCIEVGFERILTAGQRPKALEGAGLIKQLIEKAGDRIKIMPGSGVNEQTVQQIVSITGAREIHFSSTAQRESPMAFRNEAIAAMGEQGSSEFLLRTVDVERVKKMRGLAEAVSSK
ncbi:MAG: copper homeostasis protein CutC, partial [Candidatus Doudnabacteria bacterium]|nr:copper homeostasis protein CutC [Candidatus Doudnabacteria bacterium]